MDRHEEDEEKKKGVKPAAVPCNVIYIIFITEFTPLIRIMYHMAGT